MSDVSVIIPSHNVRDLVGQTIESVLGQTDPPEEILVVDDSTDDSIDVIERYGSQTGGQVKPIRVEPCNVSEARNIGIERSTRSFIAFLDADDIWLADKTRCQLALLAEDPGASGAFCGLFNFHCDLDDMGRSTWDVMADRPDPSGIIRTQMVVASATLVRREALGAIRYDERTGNGEDTIFAAELALAGPWRLVPEPLLGRRIHGPRQITDNPWHTVWNTRTRVGWCRDRADRLGPDTAARLEEELWQNLVEFVERRYWNRQLNELRSLRDKVAGLCPHVYERCSIVGRRIYPRWTYRLRDLFTCSK